METVNPQNFIDIDPNLVSFITLKDGNLIMIDELAPIKPNKVKIVSIKEKNGIETINTKEKNFEIFKSNQLNLFFKGNQKKIEPITIIKKPDFNLISSFSKNIYFSIIHNNKDKNRNTNLPSPNCSIDIKSSMFQSKKDIYNNYYLNNNKMNNLNNNIISEDNVNIHMTDTKMSKQIINENNLTSEKKDKEIIPSNAFILSSLKENNINKNIYKIIPNNTLFEENQKYIFEENKNNYIDNDKNSNTKILDKKENIDDNIIKNERIKNDNNSPNTIKTKGSLHKYNYSHLNKNNIKEKYYNKSPSMNIENNNFYSQNKFIRNSLSRNSQSRNNLTEVNNTDNSQEKKKSHIKEYNKLNKRIFQTKKDNNYVNAVVSLNIPAEEQEEINLEKQFNSLVDRLNGQKSRAQAKANLRKSDKYYELYKIANENSILNNILSPRRNKRKIENKYILDFKKINKSKINNNDISITTCGRNNNLNSRILALKERTFTTVNNSFRSENLRENYSTLNNTDIVLPSNFIYHK